MRLLIALLLAAACQNSPATQVETQPLVGKPQDPKPAKPKQPAKAKPKRPVVAPPGAYLLQYRFPEGLIYDETTVRDFYLELVSGDKRVVYRVGSKESFRRTIVESSGDGPPEVERVQVVKMVRSVKQSATEEANDKVDAAQGRSFVWRKRGEDWFLYDSAGDASARFPRLAERMRNWREARLPPKPVKPGETWEVTAKAFLETAGQPLPPELQGSARFKLEEVTDGIARISFTFGYRWTSGPPTNEQMSADGEGVWRFDVKNGRELGLEMKSTILAGDSGKGRASQKRTVKYGAKR